MVMLFNFSWLVLINSLLQYSTMDDNAVVSSPRELPRRPVARIVDREMNRLTSLPRKWLGRGQTNNKRCQVLACELPRPWPDNKGVYR
jgi:hypothetical protein